MAETIFLIAGEPSGDQRGAELVRALKKQDPTIKFEGLGGKLMQAEGVKLFDDLCALAAIGFGDVLAKYFKIRKIFYSTLHYVLKLKPDCLILIDYPGFNLRFAKQINRQIKTFYYVSPQLWAWASHRIHLIKQVVDRMLVLFHFEEKMYQEAGIPVTWVGHPLAELSYLETEPSRLLNQNTATTLEDNVKKNASRAEIPPITKSKQDLRKEFGVQNSEKAVALLPGSRKAEIERILPVILESARIISEKMKSVSFLLPESENVPREIYDSIIKPYEKNIPSPFPSPKERGNNQINSPLPQAGEGKGEGVSLNIKRVRGESIQRMLGASDAAIVTSGTATLETALTLTPFVILYKTHWTTYILGKMLIQIPYIGLVNVVAGRKIIQEFIQQDAQAGSISKEVLNLIENQEARKKVIRDLEEVKNNLGPAGASERAANAILSNL